MGQPGMRITVDAAMRARDISRPRTEGEEPPPARPAAGSEPEPGRRGKAAKNERRRLDKRGGRKPSL
ncbi:hypothetical protein ACFY4C_15760 [Actinomadura viridis]|uniref:hypothetical protein n=1 Tax=Actinomadura viridis TaxID=58110 RepID=UPI003688B640